MYLEEPQMGEFATAVQAYLRDQLTKNHPSYNWETEYSIDGTPVDVAGEREPRLYLLELEWRRADPVGNTAKLFRHLESGAINASSVVVFQLFTAYYNLQRGGVSSKRKDAEFVGRVAAETMDQLSYVPVDLELEPPKRGHERPNEWTDAVDDAVAVVNRRITSDSSSDQNQTR